MSPLAYFVSTRVATDVATLVFLKGSIIAIVLLVMTRLLHTRSAALRYSIWSAGFIALVSLPFIENFVPTWRAADIPYPNETMLIGIEALEIAPSSTLQTDASPVVDASEPSDVPAASVLLVIWWVGVLLGVTSIAFDQLRGRLWRRRCVTIPGTHPVARILEEERTRLGIRRSVSLLVSAENGFAATTGVWDPAIILGRDVAERAPDYLRALLIHELAHVKRLDYAANLFAILAMPVYWPNPLIWWVRRKAHRDREQACDDMVIARGVTSRRYATVLVDFAIAQSPTAAVGTTTPFLRFSSTKERIRAILNQSLDRRPIGSATRALIIAATLGVLATAGSLSVFAAVPGTGRTAELVTALAHADPGVRARAAATLGRRGNPDVRSDLEAALDDPEGQVRLAAMSGLVELADPASIPALKHVLMRPYDGGRGEHGFVLKYAMIALGKIGTHDAMLVLEGQLNRPMAPLRWLALETILTMPDGFERALPHLARFAASDPSERNRQLAAAALTRP